MTDSELVERLRAVEGNRPDSMGICTMWHRNPEGPEAADRIEALQSALTRSQKQAEALAGALLAIEDHETERPCRTAEESYMWTLDEVQAKARAALAAYEAGKGTSNG